MQVNPRALLLGMLTLCAAGAQAGDIAKPAAAADTLRGSPELGADSDQHTTCSILGKRVRDRSGKPIGRIIDILISPAGVPQAAVIDFGGFMGIGNIALVFEWRALHFDPTQDPDHQVTVDMTSDQLKTSSRNTSQLPVGSRLLSQPDATRRRCRSRQSDDVD